jgi:hypothetical protein
MPTLTIMMVPGLDGLPNDQHVDGWFLKIYIKKYTFLPFKYSSQNS